MQYSAGHTNVPVAIVGMACRLPGADDIDQFWRLVAEGGSVVAELPPERLDQQLFFHPEKGTRGKTYSKLGAICNSRQFHRDQCPISPELERSVDLAHLLTCEVAAAALRHAGMDPFNLKLRNTGVYIGHAQGSDLSGEYVYGTCIEEAAQFLREAPGFKQLSQQHQDAIVREVVEAVRAHTPKRGPDSPDLSIHMVAGTISKAFGLTGPYLAVNSACASSLQTMLMAVRALQLGRIDMAIVGGASDCKGDTLVLFAHAQSMSVTGSRPFDADADGLICGEGYVSLVLKTLPRALADGDPIQAIVMGLGASSDGRGKSLWAPRKEGQVAAMQRAYHNGLDMGSLQYIEAHATSTNLGDATELGALAEVLADKFPAGKKIPVTSVKANIGHTLESAGISGVIKTVMSMQNRTIPAAINIRSLNPKIEWQTAPIYVPTQNEPWPEQPGGLPRRAAVNAFGIGGLNVHVVLEEFTEARRAELRQKHLNADGTPQAWQTPATAPVAKPEDREAVAVIGMGCILPGALHPTKFWELISSGRDPKGRTPPGRWRSDLALEPGTRKSHRTPTDLGGYITDYAYDWKKHKVPPKQVEQADPLQFMLLDAADQALVDAGYDKKKFDRTRVGVMVGNEFASDFGAQLEIGLKLIPLEVLLKQLMAKRGVAAGAAGQIAGQFSDVLLNRWPALIDETGSFSTSTLASRITKTMDLMGGAAAMDGGHSSAVSALAACVDSLLSGDCDMMFCASGQRCMSLPQFEGMSVGGLLAMGERPRSPLDAAADGIVPGEGVGVLLLKRLSDARRDGDKIHAIIRGVGAAHGQTADEAIREAAGRALRDAGVAPSDVALLEFDGTGLQARDEEHIRAMLSVYGQPGRKEPLLVSTAVGQIGHTCGASAMVSLIKASMEIRNGQLPGTVGLESPMPILAQNSNLIRASSTAQPIRHASADGRQFAAVSSYGKGMAFHIVLERGEKVPVAKQAPQPAMKQQPAVVVSKPQPTVAAVSATPSAASKIVRFGAQAPDALTAQIPQALANSAAVFAAADSKQFASADRARLAIVAESADVLAKKLDAAARQLGNPAAATVLEQQGCFYRQLSGSRPRIAFLFSGQGSHYPGMLRELVRDVPAAAAMMRRLDAAMTARGFQTFAQMAWENSGQLGSDVWATQIVMLLADLIVHAAVADMGIQPDLVSGHSYGDFPALTAAGVWEIETVVAAARARYESIEAVPNARGTLMAVTAPAQQIEQLAATARERVYVANINAPDQTVVGGRPESLREFAKLLESHRIKSQMLTVPAPYHTPLMEGVGAVLRRTLDTLPMRTPRVAMLSSVTNRYVAEPDEIRANLAAQLTTPLRYLDLVARIAGEQDTVLVEVGPQQALTRLNRRILEGRPVAGIIACDNPKRPGVEQLLHVKAMLEVTGALGAPQSAQPIHVASSAARPAQRDKGTVTHVDATERRREKMRHAAVKVPAASGSNGHGSSPVPAPPSGNGAGHLEPAPAPKAAMAASRASFAPTAAVAHASIAPARAPAPAKPAPAPAPVAKATAPKPQAPAPVATPDLSQLERFLINFVVEQTGYPPEVVELDADLEADLGIDSIKKAQMFGELREYFDVTPTDNLTLDDFPTLRHIVNFLASAPQKGVAPSAPPAAVSAPPTVAATPATAPAPVSQAAVDTSQLEQFLINFVVEQTGYPPEVVELDADLEADLGIDSIKKAQMFGELREYFDVTPTDNLTLDDFPTLRHIVNFLATAPQKGVAPSPPPAPFPAPAAPVVAAAPVPAPAAQAAVDTTQLEQFLINFVVEQTGYPPEVVELDADLEADLGIDSIKKAQMFGELREYFDVTPTDNLTLDDFPTLRQIVNFLATAPQKGAAPSQAAAPRSPEPAPAPGVSAAPVLAQAPAAPTAAPAAPVNVDTSQLEQFLINFVVEQTGYPPEVVELDADLEADLGIDSIKKAQMFGELREYFDVTPTDNLTLDDFPTLRHIVNFLATAPQKGVTPAASQSAAAESAAAPESVSSNGLVTNVTMTGGSINVDVLHARGTAYEIGRQHGLEKKTEIRRILRRIADLTNGDWGELPIPAEAHEHPEQFFAPEQLEELRGIAEAVEVPLANLAALNLAVQSELAANCAQVAVVSRDGQTLHGLVGDIGLPPALVELLVPFILVREPAQGWSCATMTFAGVVGSLVGINGSGLAISAGAVLNAGASENMATRGSAALRVEGLLHRSDSIASAIASSRKLHLPGGWTACLSHHGQSEVRVAESNGQQLAESNGDAALIAANHCVLHPARRPAPVSSVERLSWLQQRMAKADAPQNAGELLALLAETPSKGTLRLAAVVDAAQGDFLLDSAEVRERVHVGALLSPAPIGDVEAEAEAELADVAAVEVSQPTSEDLHVDPAIDGQSMRFTMRMRPSPWPQEPDEYPDWKGAAAIYGSGPHADALEARMKAGGASVVRLREAETAEEAVAEFERAAMAQPIMHLFFTPLRDAAWPDRSSAEGVERLVERRLLTPYFVIQRMFQMAGEARRLDDCTVVVLVDLGGDFGFSGRVSVPESGWFTGTMKGLYLEHSIVRGHKGILCKAIDAPQSETPASLAAAVCRELAGRTNDYEITFAGGNRYVQVALPAPAPIETHSSVRPGSTWVLTGGARGITAQCGLELGRRFGLKLHLIGASPLPTIDPAWRNLDSDGLARLRSQIIIDAKSAGQKFTDVWAQVVKAIEIDRNLQAFAAAGVRYTYHACDVGDREALARVLQAVRAADGPIEGILHGAGIERARVFEKKSRADAVATLRGKINGAFNLMELTRDDPVRHFVGFGSTSGRMGGNGQGDYAAASDMLCKMVSWYRTGRPDCHAVGFHWHPWGEVGMASRPETAAMLKSHDLGLMPSRVGVRHLLRELYTRPAETEVLITDWEYHQRFYPKDVEEIAKRADLLGAPGSVSASREPSGTSATAKGVADRVVLRAVDAPLGTADAGRPLPDATLLLGDNADAEALAALLLARGIKVHRLPVADDPRVACDALEQIWHEGAVRSLMLLTARDPDAARLDDPAGAARRVERGVHLPYWVTRRWFELLAADKNTQPAALVAATSLGGDFGFQAASPAPEGGALSGLLKSIYVEDERTGHSRFVVKAIDFPADEPPARLAASICRELESGRPEVEVAWSGDRRRVVATVRRSAGSLPQRDIPRGGNWVVTGGGRGITAAAALELAQRYGLKLHLLGKSHAPDANAPWRNCTEDQLKAMKSAIVREAIAAGRSPTQDWDRVRKDREIQETLNRFHAAGVSVTYHACDVADWNALSATLDKVRAADGPIDGVIHGAGFGKPFRFGTGPVEKLRRTVAPKVDGTLALMHLTAKDPLKYFIAFGSLGGRFGGNGLSDYAAANDMLAKLCGWFRRRRPDCLTTCLHWQTWDAVGMANESEGVGITKNTFKMTFIPPAEGVQHMLDELRAGVPEAEVLISDGYFEGLYYPYKFEAQSNLIDATIGDLTEKAIAPAGRPGFGRPLISAWQPGMDGGGIGEIVFDPVNDPFLTQHRLKDKPFLPGVIGVESLAQAASLALGGRPVYELRDVRIVNGLAFNEETPVPARVTVTASGDLLQCALTHELRDRRGRVIDPARVLATASLPIEAGNEAIIADPPGRSPLGWFDYGYSDGALVYHGPPLRCLTGFMFQYDGGWGKMTAQSQAELASPRSAEGWLSPVALIDACAVCCAYYLHLQFAGVVEVPFGFDRLRWSRTAADGEKCIVRLYFRGREEKHSLFDFRLFTERDELLVEAIGYRTVLIGIAPGSVA